MQDRKVIRLMRSFSTAELSRFKKFVRSPYFNENSKVVQLHEYLMRYAPKFDPAKIDLAGAYQDIYPNDPYRDEVITKLLSSLYKLAEIFVKHEGIAQNRFEDDLALMQFFHRYQLPKFFLRQLEVFRKKWKKLPFWRSQDYYQRFLAELEYSNFVHKQTHLKGDANLQEAMEMLDTSYLLDKLQLATIMLNRQKIIKVEYEMPLMEDIQQFLTRDTDRFPPSVAAWWKAFLFIQNPDSEAHYLALKQFVLTHLKELYPNDLEAFFTFLQNNARRIFVEDRVYYKELFMLYQVQIANGLIYQDGQVLPGLVKNIVTIGLRLGKLDWAEQFLEDYKGKISKKYRENAYTFNLARVQFERKHFGEALSLLAQLDYQDPFFTLGIKRVQLMAYYELEEWELLASGINAFRVYLHRLNKVADRHKRSNLHFVNVINTLQKRAQSADKSTFAEELELREMGPLPEKDWLVAKISVIQM